MKRKEKLALESVENCGEFSNPCYKWYLKGFEAAREMATDLWREGVRTSIFDWQNIGEEEVSGEVKE